MRLPEPVYRGPTPSGWYHYNCSYCEDEGWPKDTGFHFGWLPTPEDGSRLGRYNCVRCGASGCAPALKRPYGEPAPDGAWFTRDDEDGEPEPFGAFRAGVIPGYHLLGDAESVQSRALIQYLLDRGLPAREIRRRRLGYSTDPFFAFAVMIPFLRADARVEYFQARFTRHRPGWCGRGGKYWHPPAANGWPPKGEVLYGWRWLGTEGPPTLVEGVLDAMTAPNGLAYLGSVVSKAQAKQVAARFKTAVLMPDGELSPQSRPVRRSLENLADAGVRARVCELPEGSDPFSIGAEETRELWRYIVRRMEEWA